MQRRERLVDRLMPHRMLLLISHDTTAFDATVVAEQRGAVTLTPRLLRRQCIGDHSVVRNRASVPITTRPPPTQSPAAEQPDDSSHSEATPPQQPERPAPDSSPVSACTHRTDCPSAATNPAPRTAAPTPRSPVTHFYPRHRQRELVAGLNANMTLRRLLCQQRNTLVVPQGHEP